MKDRIAFVILHYIGIEDTNKCIESIQKIMQYSKYEHEIIVVDNHSNNATGEQLQKMYSKVSNITIIINKENLGFANGNNVGFEYAKKKLNCNYIVMLNNDTYILQEDFVDKIVQSYTEYNYAILGPKIIAKDGTIYYIRNQLPTVKQVKKSILINRLLYILSYMNLNFFYKLLSNKLNKDKDNKEKLYANNVEKDIILHGCCLIFSPLYINEFDGIDKRTFLYNEEELLFIRVKKMGWLSLHNPELEIYHMEDGATNAIVWNSRKKNMFKHKNLIKSKKILYKELKEYYNENI